MASDKQEKSSQDNGIGVYDAVLASHEEKYYDPSKESFLTRAGLTIESFKRAPGSTRCV